MFPKTPTCVDEPPNMGPHTIDFVGVDLFVPLFTDPLPQKVAASQSDGTLQWEAVVAVHEHVLKEFDVLMDSVFTDFCITGNLGMEQSQTPETQNLKDLAERSGPPLE